MKFLTIALLFAGLSAQAATQVGLVASQYKLNRANQNALNTEKLGDKLIQETERVLKASYSFAVQGGAVGVITLKDATTGLSAVLPKGAIVKNCRIDVITAPTSAGSATVALGTGQTAVDLKAATAIASYTGIVACIPVGSAASSIKLTADRTMSATVAVAALTAGKFYVIVDYIFSTVD